MRTRTLWLNAILLLTLLLPGTGQLTQAALPEIDTAMMLSPTSEDDTLLDAVPVEKDVGETPRNSPVMFIENVGQFAEGARFQVRGGNSTLWLADDALWITIVEQSTVSDQRSARLPYRQELPFDQNPQSEIENRQIVNLRLSFPNANPNVRLEPFDRLETAVSYFLGNDPDGWRPAVPVWGGVRYVDLYPGIDLEMTSEGGYLVQRLHVQPGADLGQLRLRVEGAEAVELLGENGDRSAGLHLSTAVDDYTLPLLTVADAMPDTHPTVFAVRAATFDITSPFTFFIPLSAIRNQDNPSHLLYATFLGGSDSTDGVGYGIAVDEGGNTYVTGFTHSSDFPVTPGAFDTTFNGGYYDVFVAKLNSTGSDLVYATFLGGSDSEGEFDVSIDIDEGGNAYVMGSTQSSDFPVTPGAFDTTCGYNVFVAKLNSTGSNLVYATCLGGSDTERGNHIAVDEDGNAYITGGTRSSDFPVTPGAFNTTYNGGYYDVFVAKLNSTGSDLVYATFLGGSDNEGEVDGSIAIDESGNAYVMGSTQSSDFPVTPGAFDTTYNGGAIDVFVAKLNSTGSDLVYATFLGGSGSEYSSCIAVDGGGNVYVTGYTNSGDFPVTPGAFDTEHHNYWDIFVAKLNPTGNNLVYATFLGGDGPDYGGGITVDSNGTAYVTGSVGSSDFPVTPGAFDTTFSGNWDIFVAKLNSTGSDLVYATFLGGSDYEEAYSIAIDGGGNAYVTGFTRSSDFPVTPGAFDTTYNGGLYVAFVAKLYMGSEITTYSVSGRVRDAWGAGISGVTISAGTVGSATTDAQGDYILNLSAGTHVLRPSKLNYTFTPDAITIDLTTNRSGANFRGENVAVAVPLSQPFLQFPLADYRTVDSYTTGARDTVDGGLLSSWFDHDTPEYGRNDRIRLYTGDLKADIASGWVGNLPCMDGYCYDGHNGYDIVRPRGETANSNINATADGTVVAVCSSGSSVCNDRTCGAYGKQVWIDHGNNYVTLYAHLHTVSVTVGTTATADTVLGTMGCTGNSTGPHLHFGVYFNWNLRDPWITSINSARADEIVDPFGWDGLMLTIPITDPWDTPSVNLWQHDSRTATLIEAFGGRLTSPSGRVLIDIPTGVFSNTTLITLRETPVAGTSATLRSVGIGFWLQALWDWITGDNTVINAQVSTANLVEPITITVNYTDTQFTHLDTTRLTIHRWDELNQSWQPLGTTLDPIAQTAIAQTAYLGAFDLQAPLICPEDVSEPNDDYAAASLLSFEEPVQTSFDIPSDEDWFRLEAETGLTYTLETSELAAGVNTIIELYDTDAATLLAQDNDSGDGLASRLVWRASDTRSFYVRIYPAEDSVTGCEAYYTLHLTSQGITGYRIFLPLVLRRF